jgi:hypothetical protein
MIPVTVKVTPGAAGSSLYAMASANVKPFDEANPGVSVTAISGLRAQPAAWLLDAGVGLPAIAVEELQSPIRCEDATCDYPYRLLFALDEPSDATIDWKIESGMSFPAGTDISNSRIEFDQTDAPLLLAVPRTATDVVSGTLTVDKDAPQDRIVRLRYEGPRPNAWPLRAEAIVRTRRPDSERLPLTQLDLFADVGSAGRRIFADYVGPDLSIVANSFDGCAAAVSCERFLVLHFYAAPEPIKINWEVEIRVRDFETGAPVDAVVRVDELSAADAAAITALPCGERTEAAIDLAMRLNIIDVDQEAAQLARLASGDWSPDELGDGIFESMCRSLEPGP